MKIVNSIFDVIYPFIFMWNVSYFFELDFVGLVALLHVVTQGMFSEMLITYSTLMNNLKPKF